MRRGGSASWLPSMAAVVGARLGLDYPRERWADLERCIGLAAREQGVGDTDAFAHRLLRDAAGPAPLDLLAHALTVGETYFFREPRSFELLEREVLPPLIAARRAEGRPLRLWSAGCCSGEEAYSLAIVVDRLLPLREEGQVRILATDINPRFLRSAARAEFGAWSFRDAPEGLRERFFAPTAGGRFALVPRIRRMVSFSQLNLAEPGYPAWDNGTAGIDLILCRNVLMYFAPPVVQQVLARFAGSLAAGGWLCLGVTEVPVRAVPGLQQVAFDGATFHRKPAAAPACHPERSEGPLGKQEDPPSAPIAQAPQAPQVQPPPSQEPNPLHQARTHADASRLSQACAAVEQAIAQDKLDVEAHYLHAAILQELGRDAQAEQALKRAVYIEPDFALAHHALGRLALRQQRTAAALRHWRHALAALDRFADDSVLPHSDGLAAGHLRALVEAVIAARGRR